VIKPRFVGAAAAAFVACAMVIVLPAAAAPPVSVTLSNSGTDTVAAGALCEFPIQFGFTWTRTFTTYFNDDGSIRWRHSYGPEQDTFSANGKTLVGEPYQVNVMRRFENGVQVDATSHGVSEKVMLPDGSIFVVAGSLDLLGSGSGAFFTVDKGNSGNNLDAFCAALS
jgi:hypothetical protein